MANEKMSKYVTPYGSYMGEKSSMLWSSLGYEQKQPGTTTQSSSMSTNPNNYNVGFYKAGEALASAKKNQEAKVWKSMKPNSWFNTNPQQTIEALMGLQKGDTVFAFDLETLGTYKGDSSKRQLSFYSPTEIAFGRYTVNNKMGMAPVLSGVNGRKKYQVPGQDYLSILVKPTSDVHTHLESLVTKAEGMLGNWAGLTADERRTLNDLILYSGDDPFNNGMFSKVNGMTFVQKQNRQSQGNLKSVMTREQLVKAKQGLFNLMEHGTGVDSLALGLESYLGRADKYKLGGFNIQQFDIPVFMDYLHSLKGKTETAAGEKALERLTGNLANVQGIDVYQGINSLYKNTHTIFGRRLTQEAIAAQMNIKAGQSHMGIDDLSTTMKIMNKLINKYGLHQMVGKGTGVNGFGVASWNPENFKVGDQVFALQGLSSHKAGEYDGVFRKQKKYLNKEDGSPILGPNGQHLFEEAFVPAYDIKTAPIYKNVKYQIEGFYENFEPEKGKGIKLNGALLHNKDEDLYHFIGRENMADFQNLFQQHFVDASTIKDDDQLHGIQARKEDKARRRWDKMFEGGGFNRIEQNLKGLQALDHARKKGFDATKTSEFVKRYAQVTLPGGKRMKATDSFVNDLLTMEGRLRAEQQYLSEFLQSVNANGTVRGNHKLEETALKNFRILMDQTFGENVSKVQLGNQGKMLTGIRVGSQNFDVRLRDNTTIQASLRQMLYDGGKGIQTSTARVRLKQIVAQLQAKGALKSDDAGRLRQAIANIGDRPGDTAYYTILNEVSALVEREAKRNPQNIAKSLTTSIEVEGVTGINSSRQGRLKQHWSQVGPEIIRSSIQSVDHMRRNSWGGQAGGKRVMNITDPRLDQIVANHDQHFQTLLSRTGIGSSVRTKSSKEFIQKLANQYTTKETSVAFMYDARQKGLTMLVAPNDVAKEVFGLNADPKRMIADNRVAAIPLPMFTSPINLSTHGRSKEQIRLAQLSAFKDDGGYFIGTGFEESVNALLRSKNAIQRSVLKGGKDAEGLARTITNNAINNMSIRNRHVTSSNLREMGEFKGSQAAMWLRSSMLDVSAFAEDWYDFHYSDFKNPEHLKRNSDVIRAKMEKEPFTTFIDHMNKNEVADFQRHIDTYLQTEHGITTDAHSAKDTYVAQYKRATNDVRDLTVAGYLNPMARENLMKSVNYMPMEAKNVVRQLRKSLETRYRDSEGKVDHAAVEAEIERYLVRGVVTETADQVLEKTYVANMGGAVGAAGQVSYLNARGARMPALQLAGILKSDEAVSVMSELNQQGAKIDPAKLSTYDGMSLIRESTAQALQTKREKKVKLKEGEVLHENINKLFEGKKPNKDGLIELLPFEQRNLRILTGKGSGNVTVGSMTTGATIYKGHQQHVHVTGFNPQENELILGVREDVKTSFKGISDAGDRVTYTVVPDKLMDVIGKDLDVVLEGTDAVKWNAKDGKWGVGKGTFGVEVSGYLNLVQDEVRQKITVGQLAKEEAMAKVKSMIETHFNANEMIQIKNDQIIVSDVFGINNSVGMNGLSSFLTEAAKPVNEGGLGIDPTILGLGANATIQRMQVGIATADVENWERGVGAYTGTGPMSKSDGLVKWGLKEVDVIAARANRILGDESNPVTKWLRDYSGQIISEQNRGLGAQGTGFVDGLNRGLLAIDRQGVASGDVVIRTSGEGSRFETPMNSRVVGSVTEVSMDIFNNIPTPGANQGRTTVGELQKTIVSLGEAGDHIFKQALKKNSGVALFELPEGISKKYTPFFDIPLLPGDEDTPAALSSLQKSQMNVWRKAHEYMGLDGAVVGASDSEKKDFLLDVERKRLKLEQAVADHEEQIRKQNFGARDGSVAKEQMTARFDMSGQFRIQGINPFTNMEVDANGALQYTGKYKEGSAYVSESRLTEMVKGAERNIMQQIMPDQYNPNMGIGAMRKEIVDYAKTNGLYGLVGRFPTIKEDTVMSLKIMVDDTMGKDERGAYLSVGTAQRLKADNDGDFLSQVLAHYKDGNAGAIHEGLKQMHDVDVKAYEQAAVGIYEELGISANERGVTVGQLVKDEAFMTQFGNAFTARTRAEDALESLKARLGKGSVGQADNLRQKFLNLTEATHSVLRQPENAPIASRVLGQPDLNEHLIKQRKIIEELGSAFSQDLISSKKFSIEAIDAAIRQDSRLSPDIFNDSEALSQERIKRMDAHSQAVNLMVEGFQEIGTGKGNQKIREAESVLGIYGNKSIDINGQTMAITLEDMLDAAGVVRGVSGQRKWHTNTSLGLGVSEGPSQEKSLQLVRGEERTVIPTPFVQKQVELSETFRGSVADGIEAFERGVMYNLQNASDPRYYEDSLTGASSRLADMGDGTVADDTFKRLGGMLSKAGGGMSLGAPGFSSIAIGAGVFGGLWAGSALLRSGPTPESVQDNLNSMNMPVTPQMLGAPTARVTPNGENINVSISAKNAQNLSSSEIGALVQHEMNAMMNTQLNINMNVNDNTQKIDQRWLQDVVANAINSGYAY